MQQLLLNMQQQRSLVLTAQAASAASALASATGMV
jgi:hypothetical protein